MKSVGSRVWNAEEGGGKWGQRRWAIGGCIERGGNICRCVFSFIPLSLLGSFFGFWDA